jgi:hypothetical protein
LILCTEEDVLVWNENKLQEYEANEFASEILMPEVIFLRYIKVEPPNMETVKDISKEFRTSITATTLRYVQLSAEPCAVVISIGGLIKRYKKSNSFDFHIKVGENLSPNTYAFDFYDGKDLPNKPRKVPASAWLAGRINEDAELLEHSLGLTTYDVVLSLLWINEEILFNHQSHDDSEEPDFDLTNPFTSDGKRWRW